MKCKGSPSKSRFFMLHGDTNSSKLQRLESLHSEYVSYVRLCVACMLDNRQYVVQTYEMQSFFPRALHLTSQIEKNARHHAIQIVSSWASGRYQMTMKRLIEGLLKDQKVTEEQAKALYTIGKYLVCEPSGSVTQSDLDHYNVLLDEFGKNKPEIRANIPMRLSEATSRLEQPEEAFHADWWLRVSTLGFRKSLWLPLVGNPYVSSPNEVSKGILARKTKRGRWRFEAVEIKKWSKPTLPAKPPRLGVDVGLNVLAATSDGDLYGSEFKPSFDKLYQKVKQVRANRQRQSFKENSRRLDVFESKLTGQIKTSTGTVVNRLIQRHPGTLFVVEDLDLSGCRGSKRFAYRALQSNLERKAHVLKVNPAYTSQECPSCGYFDRLNRRGVKFTCRSCGRKAHADWVGASGILRRSDDQNITCDDNPKQVREVLLKRFQARRRQGSSFVGPLLYESVPSDQRLTVRVPVPVRAGLRIASNLSANVL